MARICPNNNAMLIGRVVADPYVFENKDGSRTVKFTCAYDRDVFDKQTGNALCGFVDLKGFVPAGTDHSVYDYLTRGTLVAVSYEGRNEHFVDEAGEHHHVVALIVRDVRLLARSRKAQGAAEAEAPEAEAPEAEVAEQLVLDLDFGDGEVSEAI